jgi:uncharacterized membrane protein YagU involved in acid resistance
MLKEPTSLTRKIVTGIAAGLVAGAVVGLVDRFTDRLVSPEQKRREKEIREDSAHKTAGPYFARKLLGHELSRTEKRRSRAIFGVAYGAMWGLVYAGLRERYYTIPRFMGLPFALPFFFGCDGGMAPLLGVTPGIQHLPWQVNAKELGNHIVWTMTAETVHRLASRIPSGSLDEILSNYPYNLTKETGHGGTIETSKQ